MRASGPDRANAPIVVGLDETLESLHASEWALVEARVRGVPLLAVHAWQPTSIRVRGAVEEAVIAAPETEREAASVLADQLRIAAATVGNYAPTHQRVVEGSPAVVLLEAAHGAWALVVASRRKSRLGRLVLGSVSEACVHHATCPIVVVHRQAAVHVDSSRPWRVVVGVDGSPSGAEALRFATDLSGPRHADVEVVTEARDRHAAEALCDAAAHADLLVVGRRGLSETDVPIGSVSDWCVRNALCPVAVVPA